MNRYEQIISACGFSEEMECYLIGCKLNDYNMLDIILGAPLPLTEKRKLLELLNTPGSDGYADVSKCIREFDDALAALELKNRGHRRHRRVHLLDRDNKVDPCRQRKNERCLHLHFCR